MTDDTYLITAAQIAAMDGEQKTHFLNDNAKRQVKSLGDETGLTGLGFHIVTVEPGYETTEHHLHYHEDECVYVLDGTATAYIGEDTHQIGPGDFIGYRKGGHPHSIKNTGDTLFRFIVIGQRLPHDVADYTRQDKRIFRNDGLTWNLVDHDHMTDVTSRGGKK